MNDVSQLSDTITPKSDQLNADDLITGPITVQITSVSRGTTKEQPVWIGINGRQPYKPCKTMRRVLILAWGDDGHKWVGRYITLYRDAQVKYGGVAVGGIKISHLSHIKQNLEIMLTVSRGKKSGHVVTKMLKEQIET